MGERGRVWVGVDGWRWVGGWKTDEYELKLMRSVVALHPLTCCNPTHATPASRPHPTTHTCTHSRPYPYTHTHTHTYTRGMSKKNKVKSRDDDKNNSTIKLTTKQTVKERKKKQPECKMQKINKSKK